jgi:hypothetical protein
MMLETAKGQIAWLPSSRFVPRGEISVTPIKVISPISGDPDAPTQNLLGLAALAAELCAEGITVHDLFARTGVQPAQLEDAQALISRRQRLAIYRNATRRAKRTDIGLLAGARQRLSDYGIYGYAMVSSRTFGDALMFLLDHTTMAGPPKISFPDRRWDDGNPSR